MIFCFIFNFTVGLFGLPSVKNFTSMKDMWLNNKWIPCDWHMSVDPAQKHMFHLDITMNSDIASCQPEIHFYFRPTHARIDDRAVYL